MTKVRTPRSIEQAYELLTRFADLGARLDAVEAKRKTKIGRINAAADAIAAPLITELEALTPPLEAWWNAAGAAAAPKGRKSLQLGGCMIGSKASRASLAHTFADDTAAADALVATRYKSVTTKLKYSLDRAATLRLIQAKGKIGEALTAMGFSVKQGEVFFIDRVEQAGTISA